MNIVCKNCGSTDAVEVQEIRDGDDCWIVVMCKCKKCGYKFEVKQYA